MNLPEIIYSSSNSAESRTLSRLVQEGKIRKILPKAYTSNFEQTDEEIIRKHLFQLIWKHYPEAIVSHRSAFEFEPTEKGNVYLTSSQNRKVKWPGVTLRISKGKEALDNDNPIYKTLRVSSKERAFLENLTSGRKVDNELKTIKEEVLEEKLVLTLETAGETGLNEIRDKSKKIAKALQMEKEFERLNKKVSAILSTRPSDILKSPLATAMAYGEPYDPNRIRLFQKLAVELKNTQFESKTENATNNIEFKNFAFFEGYFSNYIEGTTFEIEEAIGIIYKNKIIENRTADSHDIKGTFQICSDKYEMKKNSSSADDFINLLKARHSVIMRGRLDKKPGEFKEKANRAGNTHFVLPNLVIGTLKTAYELIASIESALGKAIYVMFIISEIHPFNDGNGRIARIMMNAELVKKNEQRIIIPTVYRDDYIGALRKLTRQADPIVFIQTLDKIWKYSVWLNLSSFDSLLEQIRDSNAFEEPEKRKLEWK